MQVGRHLDQSEVIQQADPNRMDVMIDLDRGRASVVMFSLLQSETDQCVAFGDGTVRTRVQTSFSCIFNFVNQ